MRALITGSQGFVGGYLRSELEENGYEVFGLDIHGDDTLCVNLLDSRALEECLIKVQPDIIIHLAGQANVSLSWKIPQKTIEANLLSTVNLMEAVRKIDSSIRLLLIGSSDEYGNLGDRGVCVNEEMRLCPQTPYAVSKCAQEDMARVFVRAYGLQICMTRSFNHGGAGQREGFLISDFAAGVAKVEKGIQKSVPVGNLEAKRDFTHVKDIARAYRLLAERGTAGEVYNVGSGKTYSARDILNRLINMANCPISVEVDPGKMRPNDTPVLSCDHSKLTKETGWNPLYDMNQILIDTLRFFRNTV